MLCRDCQPFLKVFIGILLHRRRLCANGSGSNPVERFTFCRAPLSLTGESERRMIQWDVRNADAEIQRSTGVNLSKNPTYTGDPLILLSPSDYLANF